jgi:hypothetical protein
LSIVSALITCTPATVSGSFSAGVDVGVEVGEGRFLVGVGSSSCVSSGSSVVGVVCLVGTCVRVGRFLAGVGSSSCVSSGSSVVGVVCLVGTCVRIRVDCPMGVSVTCTTASFIEGDASSLAVLSGVPHPPDNTIAIAKTSTILIHRLSIDILLNNKPYDMVQNRCISLDSLNNPALSSLPNQQGILKCKYQVKTVKRI